MPDMTDDKYVQIKRTMCFAGLYILNVFSCSFSSISIVEDDEKNLKAVSTVLGMSSKNRFDFFTTFFIL